MDDTTKDGRMWAAISYGSVFLGFPIGIVPLIQRNDAFALHHAKHAVATQLGFLIAYLASFAIGIVFFFLTCGMSNFLLIPFLFLLMLWPITTGIHGLILSMNGDWGEPFGAFGLGNMVFGGITLLEETEEPETAE